MNSRNPVSNVEERLVIRQIKHDDDTVCLPEKTICYRTVPILASCVPDLYSTVFSTRARVLYLAEINTRSGHLVVVKFLVDVPF